MTLEFLNKIYEQWASDNGFLSIAYEPEDLLTEVSMQPFQRKWLERFVSLEKKYLNFDFDRYIKNNQETINEELESACKTLKKHCHYFHHIKAKGSDTNKFVDDIYDIHDIIQEIAKR